MKNRLFENICEACTAVLMMCITVLVVLLVIWEIADIFHLSIFTR